MFHVPTTFPRIHPHRPSFLLLPPFFVRFVVLSPLFQGGSDMSGIEPARVFGEPLVPSRVQFRSRRSLTSK